MHSPLDILKKYWNFDEFREPQLQIIESVLEGQDTFALMPTGGGKSICFQVPAMINEGLCLVISPLVALMKDQVANLQSRGIKAIALTGGISQNETSDLLDNCQFGNYKFLYVSPERLQSDWIMDRIKALPVNLIAIDEAHCVSQWGHDFRPAYLKISVLRDFFPKVPFMALTASATKRVREDIIDQLHLKDAKVFVKSFARENLAYMVFETEDKFYRIEQILTKNPEPSIIYVRNRKSCSDLARELNARGFSATYYHGGLSSREKAANMQQWMDNKTQVIVATNAFGMGIDKPDVKTVIHVQYPENLESYYQEAGRAGRNGKKAFAVLLSSPSDAMTAENQFLSVLPDKAFLLAVYVKLCNCFQIAYGEGLNQEFSFNLNQFCHQYDFPTMKTYNALQFLDRQGVLTLSQEFTEKVTMQFLIESREVLRYMSLNPSDEAIILAIVRTYPGIYEHRTAINSTLIAKNAGTTPEKLTALLEKLKKLEIIDFQARQNDAVVIMNEVREDEHTINRISKFLDTQNTLKRRQLHSVVEYVKDEAMCKSRMLLEYFGEEPGADCGICSYCKKHNKNVEPLHNVAEPSEIKLPAKILMLLKEREMDSREIHRHIESTESDITVALRDLLEKNLISIKPNNRYTLKH